jgi:2-methylcitrate dehydratase PrpD
VTRPLSVARRLARFVRGLRLDAIPADVSTRAALLTLDTLGSVLASSTMDFGRSVIDAAVRLGGPAESTVPGAPTKIGASSAALANGTLAHGLDFDDTREDAIVHTGAVSVPAALAVGEGMHASGAAVLEAVVAGVEVMCRVGLAVPGRFHARHFHPTALTGAYAAAAAAGKLRGLTEDEQVNAFGICGSQSAGIIEYLVDGSWTKRLHAGWAAHAGLVAVTLAQAGFTGPETVFEGEHGFFSAFAGGHDTARLEGLIAALGTTWELRALTFKPYPCGSIAHPYMDCALRLRDEHRIEPAAIAAVRCRTAAGPVPRLWEPLAAKHRPPNGYAAKFSLPYLLALMFVKGRAGLAEFSEEAVRDPAVLDVAGRVQYEIDATIDYPRQFVGDVTVRLIDGRTLHAHQDHPRGGADSPLTGDELEAKFRGNARLALPEAAVDPLIDGVRQLAKAPDLGAVVRGLRSAAKGDTP